MNTKQVDKRIEITVEYAEYVRNNVQPETLGNTYEAFVKWVKHWELSKEEIQERIDNGLEVTYDDYVGYSEMLEKEEYEDVEEKDLLEDRVEGAKYMNTVWQLFQDYLNKYFK